MRWKVTYTNNRAAGLTYDFEVEADSEEQAKMRGGMACAESFAYRFYRGFYRPDPIKWERVNVSPVN